MSDLMYINLLKVIGFMASIAGVLIGLDLVFGARAVNALKRTLEKSFDFDKAIHDALDKTFDFDRIVTRARVRTALGIIFLGLSLVILFLIKKI